MAVMKDMTIETVNELDKVLEKGLYHNGKLVLDKELAINELGEEEYINWLYEQAECINEYFGLINPKTFDYNLIVVWFI